MSDASYREGRLAPLPLPAIERELLNRDKAIWSVIALKLTGGIPLAAGTVLAPTVVIVLVGWANDWGLLGNFWICLLCFAAAYVLAARKSIRKPTQSVFTEEMTKLIGLQPGSNPEELTLADLSDQEPKQAARILLQPALKGARLIYEAWQLFQAQKQMTARERSRAAELVQDLSTYPSAIPWTVLRRKSESVEELLQAMGYLHVTDCIGIAAEGRKVWLQSGVRDSLTQRTPRTRG